VQFFFEKGKIFQFLGDGYNRYDSATIYNFKDLYDEKNYQWWLADNEDQEKWKELFELAS
jgi:hypothetical protein